MGWVWKGQESGRQPGSVVVAVEGGGGIQEGGVESGNSLWRDAGLVFG